MNEQDRTVSELRAELDRFRKRLAELEPSLTGKEHQTPDPLIKNEERYHLLFDANPNPMWVYDLETLAFLEVNNTAIEKYGFTREEFLSMTIADIRPPEDIPRLRENISCVTCGLDEAGLWLHKKKDGTVIDVEIVSHTLTYKDRRAELVLARDVTAQVQAEKALRESEERYRTLLETLVLGVQENDCNGVITYGNPAYHRLLGYEDGELLGMAIWDLHTSLEEQRALRDYLALLIKEQPAPVPYLTTVRRKDGSPVDLQIDWDYQRRFDGTLKGFISVITDITERRKDREALNAAKEYAERLIETANTIVVGINLEGNITVFNRAAETITGYSRSELTNRNWFEVLVPKERYPNVWAEFERLMTGGMPKLFENPILTKSGEERTIAWQNNQVYEQGKIAGTISFGIDITERKRMEEALYLKNHVFDISIAANSIADTQGVIIQANNAFLKIWGYSEAEEVIGKKMPDFLQNTDEAAAMLSALNTAGKWEGNFTARKKDGSPFTAFGIGTTLKDKQGNLIGYQSSVLDITDHRRAEEALRESEKRYRTIVETTTEWIWEIDLAGNHIFSNQGVTAILGYHLDEFVGKSAMPFMHKDDRQEVESVLPRLIADKQGWKGWVLRWRHKDGTYRYLESNASPVINAAGKCIGYLGADRDITERKRAEEALRQSELKYRTLFDSATDAVFILDLKGNFLDVNRTAHTRLGYTKQELLSMHISRLDPPEFAARVPERLAQISRSGEAVFESAHTRKDGSVMPVEVNSRLLDYEGQKVYFSIIRDITERKQFEEALRSREEQLRVIFETSQAGIILVDPKGTITFANSRMAEMFGMPLDQLIGTPYPEHVHETERSTGDERMRQLIRGDIESVSTERHYVRADGTDFWGYLSGKRLENPDGSLRALVGVIADITDRKRAEQERLDLERRLLHTQKLESLGVLAGGVAHDFNNLLMAILGNLDMALIKLPPGSPAVMNIEQSAQAARRASDLTRQMLAYSGKGRFLVKPTDLNELVEENVRLFRVAIAKTTTFSLHLSRPLPLIEADKGQLQQVVMNLLTNAAEALGDNPGVISLSTGVEDSDAQYLAQSRTPVIPPAGRFVYLEVSDTGSGMDEQTQQRLFDPFFTTKTMGRGLGMSAILGIVSGHRGAVFVDSAEGQGTSIRVLFPEIAGSMPKKSPEPVGAERTRKGALCGTVLVVDDEEIVRNVCSEMAASLGMEVLTASDGEEALKVYRENSDRITCVILDLTMPKKDGMTAFREIISISPDAKVILSSGYDEKDCLQPLSGLGLAGFIQKPYTLENLHRVLVNAMNT